MNKLFYQKHLFFCVNQKKPDKKCCQAAQAEDFFQYAKKKIQALDLWGPGKIRVSSSGCLGRCARGPVLVIYPDAVWYTYHTEADIDLIIHEHIQNGRVVASLLLGDS